MLYEVITPGWTMGFFTANPDLAEMTGMVWQSRYRLFNGPIKCQLLVGNENQLKDREPTSWTTTPLPAGSPGEDLANRLIKNCNQFLPSYNFV